MSVQLRKPKTFDDSIRCQKENELLTAIIEDEANWLSKIFPNENVNFNYFFQKLADGYLLCLLANYIQQNTEIYLQTHSHTNVDSSSPNVKNINSKLIKYFADHSRCSKDISLFTSRENVEKFLNWCREFGVKESILFESNDCVQDNRDGKREMVICLMELARKAKFLKDYIDLPELVILEDEVDKTSKQINENSMKNSTNQHESTSKINTNDKDSKKIADVSNLNFQDRYTSSSTFNPVTELDKKIHKLLEEIDPKIKVWRLSEGQFKIFGKLVFVRTLNDHLLVRIGGGWDTLEHYIEIQKQRINLLEETIESRLEKVNCNNIVEYSMGNNGVQTKLIQDHSADLNQINKLLQNSLGKDNKDSSSKESKNSTNKNRKDENIMNNNVLKVNFEEDNVFKNESDIVNISTSSNQQIDQNESTWSFTNIKCNQYRCLKFISTSHIPIYYKLIN